METINGISIHPSAVVDPTAVLNEGVSIGAMSYVGPKVILGKNVRIGVGSIIGGPPEHKDYWDRKEFHGVLIDDGCYISNQVTIDAGTEKPTKIRTGCIILKNAHVGHDAHVMAHCTLSCSSIVGGHTVVGPNCNLGLHATLHQCISIPEGVMIGMGGIVTKKSLIRAWHIYAGNPVKELRYNQVGFDRAHK